MPCHSVQQEVLQVFLRISSALFFVLPAGLKVWCSDFFNDFSTLATLTLTDNTEKCVGLPLDLLGIQYAQSGKKCLPFAGEMLALGLVFDLRLFGQGKVFIRHAPLKTARTTGSLDGDFRQWFSHS